MKALLVALTSLSLYSCSGDSSQSETIMQDDQATTSVECGAGTLLINGVCEVEQASAQIPVGFGSGVDGGWYCASTYTDDQGAYRADWNSYWQLDFNSDGTVSLLDGSNSLHNWFYSDSGVAVQWAHTGQSVIYLPNVNNFGGMADGGSHCLRELPPTESVNFDFVDVILDCTNNMRGGNNYTLRLNSDFSVLRGSIYQGKPDYDTGYGWYVNEHDAFTVEQHESEGDHHVFHRLNEQFETVWNGSSLQRCVIR